MTTNETPGWVYRRNGQYLRYCCTPTSTGLRQELSWVADLQLATVFYTKPTFRRTQDESITNAEMLPAAESRQVALIVRRFDDNPAYILADVATRMGVKVEQQLIEKMAEHCADDFVGNLAARKIV